VSEAIRGLTNGQGLVEVRHGSELLLLCSSLGRRPLHSPDPKGKHWSTRVLGVLGPAERPCSGARGHAMQAPRPWRRSCRPGMPSKSGKQRQWQFQPPLMGIPTRSPIVWQSTLAALSRMLIHIQIRFGPRAFLNVASRAGSRPNKPLDEGSSRLVDAKSSEDASAAIPLHPGLYHKRSLKVLTEPAHATGRLVSDPCTLGASGGIVQTDPFVGYMPPFLADIVATRWQYGCGMGRPCCVH